MELQNWKRKRSRNPSRNPKHRPSINESKDQRVVWGKVTQSRLGHGQSGFTVTVWRRPRCTSTKVQTLLKLCPKTSTETAQSYWPGLISPNGVKWESFRFDVVIDSQCIQRQHLNGIATSIHADRRLGGCHPRWRHWREFQRIAQIIYWLRAMLCSGGDSWSWAHLCPFTTTTTRRNMIGAHGIIYSTHQTPVVSMVHLFARM